MLTKMSSPSPEEWYKHIDLVQKLLNSTPSGIIGASPFESMFGTRMSLLEIIVLRNLIEEEWEYFSGKSEFNKKK